MLDGILGAAGPAALIPGGQVLGVVAAGLELAKGLFAKGDMQGTQDMLKMLNEIVSKLSGPGGQAAEAMPFTQPMGLGNAVNAAFNKSTVDITIDVKSGGGSPQPVNYGRLPEVDGSAAGDQRLNEAATGRIDGNDANKNRALTRNTEEWTAVMWAMHQNPNVRYNADTKEFTLKMTDGTDRKLCTLDEARQAVGPGGFNRSQPTGLPALGDFLNQRTNEVRQGDDLGKVVDELKKLLAQFEEAQKMMRTSTVDITITHAVA